MMILKQKRDVSSGSSGDQNFTSRTVQQWEETVKTEERKQSTLQNTQFVFQRAINTKESISGWR